MEEVWKDIKGYEGFYMISNQGRVKSLNYMNKEYEQVLKPKKHNKGYLQVQLKKGGDKTFTIHRLVAQTFLPNPLNLPFVNHKDENRQNNCVENLEWCDCSYNTKYSLKLHPERCGSGTRKARSSTNNITKLSVLRVNQYDLNGNYIKTWDNARTIFRETKMSDWAISECCRDKRKSAYGYIWQYAN